MAESIQPTEATKPNKEQLGIKSDSVWREFTTFEKSAKEGYATHAGRLSSYRQLMISVTGFFSQPRVLDRPTPEIKELVGKLFYRHENTVSIPVDFFVDTREKLVREVLDEGRISSGSSRWTDEVSLIRNLSEKELHATTLHMRKELRDQEKLVVLAGKEAPDIVNQALAMEITSQSELRQRIQERAIELLASQDKTLALTADVHKRDSFIKTLEDIAVNYDPSKVESLLSKHTEYLERTDGTLVLDDVKRRLFLKQHKVIRKMANDLAEDAGKPEFIWKKWVEKGIIPPSLLNSFEEIVTLSELQNAVQALSGMPKEVRAKHLFPFLGKGINAGMLMELAEGRFEFPDDFIAQQIDAFIHFYDTTKPKTSQQKKGWSLSRALVTAAFIAAVATQFNSLPDQPDKNQVNIEKIIASIPTSTPTLTSSPTSTSSPTPTSTPTRTSTSTSTKTSTPEEITGEAIVEHTIAEIQEYSKTDLKVIEANLNQESPKSGNRLGRMQQTTGGVRIEHVSETRGIESSQPSQVSEGGENKTSSSIAESLPSVAETASMPDFGVGKPNNDSPEGLLDSLQVEIWHIDGHDLAGHYRSGTASYFNSDTHEWVDKNLTKIEETTLFAPIIDATLYRDSEKISSQVLNIPVRPDFAIASVGVHNISAFEVHQRVDGTYFIYFPNKGDIGKTISVYVGLGRVDTSIIPAPDARELKDMTESFITFDDLPADMKQFINELNQRKDIAQVQKAQLLEAYIQNNFLYSLDTGLNDYYHQGEGAKGFFKRMVEIRKLDCDMSNTVLIFWLRQQGIPARFAGGFMNSGLDGSLNKLSAGEAHGWTEAFIDGKWVTLDATPINFDDFTKKALEGKLPSGQSPSLDQTIDQKSTLTNEQSKLLRKDSQINPTPTSTPTKVPETFHFSTFTPESIPQSPVKTTSGAAPQQTTTQEGEGVLRFSDNEIAIKIINRSVESVEKDQNTVDWEISGTGDLWGYYKTGTASLFFRDNEWVTGHEGVATITTAYKNSPERTISHSITVNDNFIQLPIDNSFTLAGPVLADAENGQFNASGYVYRTFGGVYYLGKEVNDLLRGETITLSFGLARENETLAIPDVVDREDMNEQLVGVGSRVDFPLDMGHVNLSKDSLNLPQDVQDFLRELSNRKELSDEEKAKVMEKYIQTTFLYSRNQAWSDFYHQAKNKGSFINRIFEIKKADSDVANTALIALLRFQGIPSRMVFGYAHNGLFNSDEKTLKAAEKQSWVEVYINRKWVTLDATPSQMDAYTEKSLKGISSETEKQNEATAAFLYSIKDYVRERPIETTLELLTLLNTLAYGVSIIRRTKSNKLATRLRGEVQKRVKEYLGDSNFPDTIENRLEREDLNKIWSEYFFDSTLPNLFSLLIPPTAIVGFLGSSSQINALKKLPYAKGTAEVRQGAEPDLADFLINVLGYKEADVKRKIQEKAYNEITNQLQRKVWDSLYEVFPSSGTSDSNLSFNQHMYKKAYQTVSDLVWRSPDTTDWENAREGSKRTFYEYYSKEFEKAKSAKNAGEFPDPLSKEEIDGSLDQAFQYSLAWRIANATHAVADAAKALLDKGKN